MVIFRRLLVSLCLFSICFAQEPAPKMPPPRKCPDVPIVTSDGKTIHVSEYHDKVVMILVFSTVCGHCLETLQFMARLENEMAARGLQVVAISIDDTEAPVRPFAERYRFPFPVGYLTPAPALQLLNMQKGGRPLVPILIFVDWMGNVRFQYKGSDSVFKGEKDIRGIVTGLLRQAAEKKGPTYQTKPAGKP
ncbi:MAG: TlpA disulfide reductase family protein [Bryobacteraceae bacterium]|jgi:thiol-disulfide isomerase/thioredoxin